MGESIEGAEKALPDPSHKGACEGRDKKKKADGVVRKVKCRRGGFSLRGRRGCKGYLGKRRRPIKSCVAMRTWPLMYQGPRLRYLSDEGYR